MKKYLIALALCALGSAQAAPLTYNFSYTVAPGVVLAGSLVGELQSDNNTINIQSVVDFASYNGSAAPALPFVSSWGGLLTNGQASGTAITSLDGLVQDWLACTDVLCSGDFFGFLPASFNAPDFLAPLYAGSTNFGDGIYAFDDTQWTISEARAVPEPGSLMLAVVALAGLFATRRRISSGQR